MMPLICAVLARRCKSHDVVVVFFSTLMWRSNRDKLKCTESASVPNQEILFFKINFIQRRSTCVKSARKAARKLEEYLFLMSLLLKVTSILLKNTCPLDNSMILQRSVLTHQL